ncbi:AAA family ATPase [Bacillus mycoides]|uniref:ATP-dependent nuclease n=1 Tax=Bacillus mycoides TaxID=1405 RepID=UPI003D1FDF1E
MNLDISNEIKVIGSIAQAFSKGAYDNYIGKLTFPFYKNFVPDTKLTFGYPVTVLVGKNGCGKSSALQALYGAPKGKNISDFWFSTNVDPIAEFGTDKRRHCFFYEYKKGGSTKEVLYHRMIRGNQPDYWETSRPVKSYGMQQSATRNSPIEKNVLYLDFRSELSAFDKFFYFGELGAHLASKKKQDYIRNQSRMLKNVLDNDVIYNSNGKQQNQNVYELNQNELDCISFILGRTYSSGKIVEHKLFKTWGTSIILDRSTFMYSEAHAGSGEIAIVKLVHELLKAECGSLILLDEPEVSLHPGAQKRLKYLLLKLSLEKKHQVVISTHSSNFVENMPKEAIKKFELNQVTNKINVYDGCYPKEAFVTLGQALPGNYIIQTEDALATKILKAVLDKMGTDYLSMVELIYYPGGAEAIKGHYIPVYSQKNIFDSFIVFDGDQRPNVDIIDIKTLPLNEINVDNLQSIIKECTNCEVRFIVDGNNKSGGRSDQKLELQKKYLEYYKDNVYFLPLEIPEQIIWDEECIMLLVREEEDKKAINEAINHKQKIALAAKSIFFGESKEHINSLEDMLINNWLARDSDEKEKINKILTSIIERCHQKQAVRV